MTAQPETPYRCAACGAPVYRVHRQFIDRLINIFVRVRRCQCADPGCQWEGRLRKVHRQ